MSSEVGEEIERLHRSLWRSRIIIAALIAVDVAALSLVLGGTSRPKSPGPRRVEVLEDVKVAQGRPLSDQETVYFSNGQGEVYLHVMAPGQSCPFHLHTGSEEVVLIVSGGAHVSQSRVVDGGVVVDEREVGRNALVESPTDCGHSFMNRDPISVLANLVFTMPGYDGNFYVSPSDPRLLHGAAPYSLDLQAERERFAQGASVEERRTLPILNGHLVLLQAKGQMELPNVMADQILYVWGGAGELEADASVKLSEGALVVLAANHRATVRAKGSPLSLLVFTPGNGSAQRH